MASLLADAAIAAALETLPGWSRRDHALVKTFAFAGFPDAIAFVTRTAFAAERLDHHPDLDIRYDKVHVVLSTHSAGGITDLDVQLAREMDRAVSPS